jgi:D-sedoheptulose 7-phosphate isomerase
MSLSERIRGHFQASIETKQRTLETSLPQIVAAIEHMVAVLRAGNKVLSCGNGGSAADAQHFAAELTCRFERERPGLAAISLTTDTSALTAIGNDYAFEQIFSKQVQALAKPGDLLLAISTSGNSANVVKAIEAMHTAGGSVLALTGRDGGKIAKLLKPGDLELRSASHVTARIQETHLVFLHCLCDGVDEVMYPDK